MPQLCGGLIDRPPRSRTAQTLLECVKKTERDSGVRAGVPKSLAQSALWRSRALDPSPSDGTAGFDPAEYSGHSLRAGLAASATRAVSQRSRPRSRRPTSDAMLLRHVREGELFVGNAAGALLCRWTCAVLTP
jgi:hypothetical protein